MYASYSETIKKKPLSVVNFGILRLGKKAWKNFGSLGSSRKFFCQYGINPPK